MCHTERFELFLQLLYVHLMFAIYLRRNLDKLAPKCHCMCGPQGNWLNGVREVQLEIFHNTFFYFSTSSWVTQNGFIKVPIERAIARSRAYDRDWDSSVVRPSLFSNASLMNGRDRGGLNKNGIYPSIKSMCMRIVGIIPCRGVEGATGPPLAWIYRDLNPG